MEQDPNTELRQVMVEVIALHAQFAREHLGKDTLDPRVLRAMAMVPRKLDNPLFASF